MSPSPATEYRLGAGSPRGGMDGVRAGAWGCMSEPTVGVRAYVHAHTSVIFLPLCLKETEDGLFKVTHGLGGKKRS